MAAMIVGFYALYIDAGWRVFGFLSGYVTEENLAAGTGIYWLDLLSRLTPLPTAAGKLWLLGATVALSALGAWMIFIRDEAPSQRLNPVAVARDVAIMATAATLALTPHYPWYFAWLALPACLFPAPCVICLSAAAIVQYHDPFHDQALQFSIIYLPFLVLAWRDLRRRPVDLVFARSL